MLYDSEYFFGCPKLSTNFLFLFAFLNLSKTNKCLWQRRAISQKTEYTRDKHINVLPQIVSPVYNYD